MSEDFLFELGLEELPSGFVKPMADAFQGHLLAALERAGLAHGKVKSFAGPRRMAIFIENLAASQETVKVSRRGPALAAAYDKDGQPSNALLGFARSCQVELESLSVLRTDKGEWLIYETEEAGKQTPELLPTMIQDALSSLPIAKPMRWGDSALEFVRPVHWALMLYGRDCIETEVLGLKTDRKTYGHRFHAPRAIEIAMPAAYEAALEKAYVIADFEKRREQVAEQTKMLAESIQGRAIIPDLLLDEVTSIVEWPQALLGQFHADFLDVPAEALIASMQSHQKCFAVKDAKEQMMPYFIAVANIESQNPDSVVKGNEKVMQARLSDAAFFYKQDKKQPLSAYAVNTANVVFQKDLGTLKDKTLRMESLMLQWQHALDLSEHAISKAAELSKADLMTGMVGEFPELQGLMGYYYALNDQEELAVAKALFEQYLPRFSGDDLPETSLGTALSMADRLDTIVGIFAIGKKPSGEKDPFKLRRHAHALVRMLSGHSAHLKLSSLIEDSAESYADRLSLAAECKQEIKQFILDRLQAWYIGQGFTVDLIAAALACQDEWLFDLRQRLLALKNFIQMEESTALAAACKRVNNILAKTAAASGAIDEDLLQEAAEKSLYHDICLFERQLEPLYVAANYSEILKQLAALRTPVDAFFDSVMVMAEDEALKTNRLEILSRLQALLMGVADISLLQTQSGL